MRLHNYQVPGAWHSDFVTKTTMTSNQKTTKRQFVVLEMVNRQAKYKLSENHVKVSFLLYDLRADRCKQEAHSLY